MYSISVTIYELFVIEMCMTLTLIFVMGRGTCKCANLEPLHDFLIDLLINYKLANIHNYFSID